MKGLRISLIVFAAAVVTFGLSGMAFAFHSGGVAECMGCHNVHDAVSTSFLLIAHDASSTCANAKCHGASSPGSYHILSADVGGGFNNQKVPRQMTPGGDFGWLLKDYSWVPRAGSSETDLGEHHGHNIVAADIPGFIADDNNLIAPGGGTMSGSQLGCTSCHDQHGKLRRLADGTFATTGAPTIASGSYNNSPEPAAGQAVGVYRLLRGTGGPAAPASAGGVAFNTIFHAVVKSTYNTADNNTVKVAYGAGISDWCATCHPDMLSASSAKHTHVTNQPFSGPTQTVYNTYLGSGRAGASGFDTLVPFQNDNFGAALGDYVTLKTLDNAVNSQADGTSRVMCLSCHRAHASGFEFMGRWNNAGEFIAVDGVWPGTDSPSTIATAAKYAQGRTVAETKAAYNGSDMRYSSYQRSLCNKCHAKD